VLMRPHRIRFALPAPYRTSLAVLVAALLCAPAAGAQQTDSIAERRAREDSLFIAETENRKGAPKVQHAEPLYIDLIRDLGARKGEAEWNVGWGMKDKKTKDEVEMLVEYEWAVRDRLGLEIEVPVTFYSRLNGNGTVPPNRVESLKLAAQRTMVVDTVRNLSFAVGYIHQFVLRDPAQVRVGDPFRGNVYNPFGVVAKRWGTNWHTLVYGGYQWERDAAERTSRTELHTSVHYLVPGTRNFVGLETNGYREQGNVQATLRPQVRLGIRENLLLGIATSVPLDRRQEGMGTFMRLIWEPMPHGHARRGHHAAPHS
jgi:hypothetical protein